MYWRYTWWEYQDYRLCSEIPLPQGLVVSAKGDFLHFVDEALYTPACYKDKVPMLNVVMGYVMHQYSKALPVARELWTEFAHTLRGRFANSVVAIIYLISVSAVLTLFLTIFVLTNYTIKPLMLLKLLSVLLLAYILAVVIRLITDLHQQQSVGYLKGLLVLDTLNKLVWLQILDLITVFLLQVNQVQVVMRIFQRQKERRMTLLIGVFCAVCSQVIWGIAKFATFPNNQEAADILPAFIYLVRIAMAVCYATIVLVFMLSKIHYIYHNLKIWVILGLTFVLIYSPVAFFVADVSNAFIYELSEVFSVVTYVICVVLPWEWCNKFNMIMKVKEKEGVLGRRFYEDEMAEIDRYEIFEDKLDDDSVLATGDHDALLGKRAKLRQKMAGAEWERVQNAYQLLKQAVLKVTDGIIAAGFLIPRSVSVGTDDVTPRDPVRTTTNPRHNVYVYDRREVVIDFSDGEEDDPQPSSSNQQRQP
ncbi:hypothetical protein JNB11_00460 [Kocuria palustris]|nr:hypothetical protein [Kocuria palustris]